MRYCGSAHVELRAVLVVKILNILIVDGDLGHHFVIDDLLNGKLLADVVLQIVHRVAAHLELALKFFLGVGALEFGELVLDLAIGGLQGPVVFALFQQNVIVDQLIQHIQPQRQRFVLRGLRRIGVQLRLVDTCPLPRA